MFKPCVALLSMILITHAAHAVEMPSSSMGNVDCGKDYWKTNQCVAIICKSDAECKNPQPGQPGGLLYGCLTDAHACGWQYPQQPK